jgi:hypothetical protein
MRTGRLVRSPQFINSLLLANRLAPRALLRRKPLEVRHNLVSSEVTVTQGVRPLDV